MQIPAQNMEPLQLFTEFTLLYSTEVNDIFVKTFEGVTSDLTSILKEYIAQYCFATTINTFETLGIGVLTTKLYASVSHFFEFLYAEAKLEAGDADYLRDFLERLTIQAYQTSTSASLVVLMDLSPEVLNITETSEDLFIHVLTTNLHRIH